VKEGWPTLQETKTLYPDVPRSTSQTLWLEEDGEVTTIKKENKTKEEWGDPVELIN
jgi:hypothetical protein